MLYLSRFAFPDWDDDYQFRLDLKRTCYNSIYPFFVLSERGLTEVEFAPVTVFYGGNGSGKTTALNVIAEALSLRGAKIYDLDAALARIKRWTQLEDVRVAYDFFFSRRDEFDPPPSKS